MSETMVKQYFKRKNGPPIEVIFLGESSAEQDLEPFLDPSRKSLFKSIINSHDGSWRATPHHEFLDNLKAKGLKFDEYLIQKDASLVTIIFRDDSNLL